MPTFDLPHVLPAPVGPAPCSPLAALTEGFPAVAAVARVPVSLPLRGVSVCPRISRPSSVGPEFGHEECVPACAEAFSAESDAAFDFAALEENLEYGPAQCGFCVDASGRVQFMTDSVVVHGTYCDLLSVADSVETPGPKAHRPLGGKCWHCGSIGHVVSYWPE